MMTGMTGVGAFLSSNHPPERQWDLARRVDALGFDSIWTGDHVSFHLPRYDSMALLASYASITRRVKLGCAVYLLALRPPAVAAQATATLDVLSGGRLIFGVGVGGENPKEFELCGVPHRERGARVTEAIDVLRTLWRDNPASFAGRFTRFDGASIEPRPVQKPGPPILIGGRSDAALARAARQGDGWVSYVVTSDGFARSLEKIRRFAAAHGRALDGFTTAHLTFITLDRDRDRARRRWVSRLSARYAQDFGPLADRYGVIGTADECLEQIERFRAAGCGYFLLNPICEPEEEGEQLEAIASELLPRLGT
jgi:probable F420-dependent oxidoreductase